MHKSFILKNVLIALNKLDHLKGQSYMFDIGLGKWWAAIHFVGVIHILLHDTFFPVVKYFPFKFMWPFNIWDENYCLIWWRFSDIYCIFLLSLVLMTYVLSQSLPWDTNYEWIASFKISDSCPVIISCVALWKVLKLKNNITLITFKSCPCQVLFPEYNN